MADLEFGVSEFVALLNQTLEFAYPAVTITGELANLRVSKGKWLYFDLKDESSSVKFFGTVYHLPGPLEDGMLVKVRATPRLHNLYGFSLNVQSMSPAGEGSIKKAAELLRAKLTAEGLFDESRKRPLPYPPQRIGLVTSAQSAAYADFVKILNARWGGVKVELIDVQVQGEPAIGQIVAAVEQFNSEAVTPDVLVLIRGGGSAEDLAAFSSEPVTRAVAASRAPTLVAIGHEVDLSLAELAADRRASTPSNAAELLVPDKRQQLVALSGLRQQLGQGLSQLLKDERQAASRQTEVLQLAWKQVFDSTTRRLSLARQLLEAYSPQAALSRGYSLIRADEQLITSIKALKIGQELQLELGDGIASAQVTGVSEQK